MNPRLVAIGAALGVATCDLLQVALRPWVPKHAAALGGAALYLVCAAGLARRSRVAAGVVAVMPVVPFGTLALWAAGAPVPVTPDGAMVGVALVQLVAAGGAAVWMRGERSR